MRVATKGGYGVEGVHEWTAKAIARGMEEALARVGAPLEIFFLHSCPLEVARRDDILRALQDAIAAGKIARAGYSGEGEALAWAAHSGHYGALECSLNVCDQANLGLVREAGARGLLVFAKRSKNVALRLTF